MVPLRKRRVAGCPRENYLVGPFAVRVTDPLDQIFAVGHPAIMVRRPPSDNACVRLRRLDAQGPIELTKS